MFGKKKYLKLLNLISNKGYQFCDFLSDHKKKSVCLRHDIDFSIEYAFQMAEMEYKNGISSSYFFMLSSNFYNIFSLESYRYITKIADLGHSISLHFDPSIYDDISTSIYKEVNIFQSLFQTKVSLISIHRPGKFLEQNAKFSGRCLTRIQLISNEIVTSEELENASETTTDETST